MFLSFFIICLSFFIIVYHFSSIPPLEAEKILKKNDLKNEKNSRKIAFFIFRKMFAPLEAKMMKNDKKK